MQTNPIVIFMNDFAELKKAYLNEKGSLIGYDQFSYNIENNLLELIRTIEFNYKFYIISILSFNDKTLLQLNADYEVKEMYIRKYIETFDLSMIKQNDIDEDEIKDKLKKTCSQFPSGYFIGSKMFCGPALIKNLFLYLSEKIDFLNFIETKIKKNPKQINDEKIANIRDNKVK